LKVNSSVRFSSEFSESNFVFYEGINRHLIWTRFPAIPLNPPYVS